MWVGVYLREALAYVPRHKLQCNFHAFIALHTLRCLLSQRFVKVFNVVCEF